MRKSRFDGYVYIALSLYGDWREELGEVKIGFSKDPEGRIRSINTCRSDDLLVEAVIAGTVEDERALHRQFSNQHIRREWFRYDEYLAGFVERLVDAQNVLILTRERDATPPTMKECMAAMKRSLGNIAYDLVDDVT